MEFRIKHETPLFFFGIIFPLILLVAALLLAAALGITLQNEVAAMAAIGLLLFSSALEILFIILYVTEKICGAKIIVGTDRVILRMLLRRRVLPFCKIEETKYSHYEGTEQSAVHSHEDRYYETSNYSHFTDYFYHRMTHRQVVRAQLDFYLTSGKCISLNDDASSYRKLRERAKVDLRIDPDENVRLYQAYKCYCSARDHYANALRAANEIPPNR